jgi:DNA polymerase III alpha subunit
MRTDKYGQQILNQTDLCNAYLTDPDIVIKNALVDHVIQFNEILDLTTIPEISTYTEPSCSVDAFDQRNQKEWFIPNEYKHIDIAKIVLDRCQTDQELQRAGEELLLFQERNLFPLLRYLKYLVDTMRKYNVIWGVGRGSSVASFVLFLLEVHRINSLYYDLPIEEFLK